MKISEQIDAFTLKRQEAVARQKAIMEKAAEDGRTLEDEESAEYDSLKTELKAIDAHLARLADMESDDKETAQPVEKTETVKSKLNIHVKNHDPDDKFEGQSFIRRQIAKALAHLSGELTAAQVAEHRWGKSHPNLVRWIKAAVDGGASTGTNWGNELVSADARYTGDFIAYLENQTVYDQLPLREVPANVTIKGQDGIATGFWVGESASIPVSAQDFSEVNLTPKKVAAICVTSNELLRDSSPSAEALVRDGMVRAIAQRIDQTFLGSGSVSSSTPAGILQGLASLGSNGITADALRQDVKELYAPFIAANNATGLVYVMTPSLAKAIQLLYNALGQPEFNDISASGGSLLGDRVVTGNNVGSTNLILLKPSEIYRIGSGGIEVSLSRDATIEQDSQPQGFSGSPPVASSATLMSMFGTESTAFKVVRSLNFQKRRSSAVAFIGDAQYGTAGATTA